MRQYTSEYRPGALDSSELDPCIAAETRLKKSVMSTKKKRTLCLAVVLAFLLIAASLLLVYLIASPPNDRTLSSDVDGDDVEYEDLEHGLGQAERAQRKEEEERLEGARGAEKPEKKVGPVRERVKERPAPILAGVVRLPVNDGRHGEMEEMVKVAPTAGRPRVEATQAPPIRPPVKGPRPIVIPATKPTTTSTTTSTSTTTTTSSTTTTTTTPAPTTTTSSTAILPVMVPAPPSISTAITPPTTTLYKPYVRKSEEAKRDCSEHREDELGSGVYRLAPEGANNAFEAFCDMVTTGGGWTVIQRRTDNSEPFYNRTWEEYAEGFGRLDKSHWLGLEKMARMAGVEAGLQWTLRIELLGDFCTNSSSCSQQPDGFWWGEWDFGLGPAVANFPLHVSPIVAGNLSVHDTAQSDYFYNVNNGKPFTTMDRDNDKGGDKNCAQFRNIGAWWHYDCSFVALNGMYGDTQPKLRSQVWLFKSQENPKTSYYIHPKQSIMMIRPKIN